MTLSSDLKASVALADNPTVERIYRRIADMKQDAREREQSSAKADQEAFYSLWHERGDALEDVLAVIVEELAK